MLIISGKKSSFFCRFFAFSLLSAQYQAVIKVITICRKIRADEVSPFCPYCTFEKFVVPLRTLSSLFRTNIQKVPIASIASEKVPKLTFFWSASFFHILLHRLLEDKRKKKQKRKTITFTWWYIRWYVLRTRNTAL